MFYHGDFAEDDTVLIPFNTFTSDDPSASSTITNLADADIKVHKDGHVDQITTDGATIAINFDGITGNHLITIDTSADAAYATGSEYTVRIEGTTVDGATINAWVGCFSIERAGGALALLKTINIANGAVESDLTYIHGSALTETAGQLAAAFKKLFDVASPLLVASDVMRGTDSANTTVPDAAGTAAVPGDAMNLAADAIKKVSYDESTAYPIESADTGSTKIARTGADSDTLETLSDEVAAIPTTAMRGTDSAATEAKQDIIDTNVDTTLTRLSAARAGYLDNLNIGENVAGTSEATSIKNNPNGHISITASFFIVPTAGTNTYRIEFFNYDSDGNMEAPDAAPTISVDNQAGTSRNANLSATTMSLVATGRYRVTYDVDSAHAIEQLNFVVSAVEGGATKIYGAAIVASDDQSKVDALYAAILTAHSEVTAAPGKDSSLADKIETLFHPVKNGVDTDSTAGTAITKNDDGTAFGTQTITEDLTNSDIGKMT